VGLFFFILICQKNNMAKWIIILGLGIVLIGTILYFFPNAFKWFGNLPGDINTQKENSRIFIPITSMILLTVAFNVLLRFIKYFE